MSMPGVAASPGTLFEAIEAVSPALAAYTRDTIMDDLWGRPGLAARDRAVATVSILVSRNASSAYKPYLDKALDSGVSPAELSELLTHLAFYTGFAYAFGAVSVLDGIFAERGIGAQQLPAQPLPLLDAEGVLPPTAMRKAFVDAQIAPASEALAHYTEAVLHGQLWLRPVLTTRERSLATIASLCAQGQWAGLSGYLARALHHGATRQEIGEVLGHVAFYAGWGNAVLAATEVNRYYASLKA